MPTFTEQYVLQITFAVPYWLVQILVPNRFDWPPFFTLRKFYLQIKWCCTIYVALALYILWELK